MKLTLIFPLLILTLSCSFAFILLDAGGDESLSVSSHLDNEKPIFKPAGIDGRFFIFTAEYLKVKELVYP